MELVCPLFVKIPRNQHSLNGVERILDTQTHCAKKVWSYRIACPLFISYTFALRMSEKTLFLLQVHVVCGIDGC